MTEILESPFMKTVMSDVADVEQKQLMTDFEQLHTMATSYLDGDWKEASKKFALMLFILNLHKEGKKRFLAHCN